MAKPTISLWAWRILIALALGYEAYSLVFLQGETLSEGAWYAFDKHPLLYLVFGALIVHFVKWVRKK